MTDTEQNDLATVHIYASGRVQGVGFRYFVTRRAAELGITGFVRNTSDGRVEVRAEGPKPALETLEEDREKVTQYRQKLQSAKDNAAAAAAKGRSATAPAVIPARSSVGVDPSRPSAARLTASAPKISVGT